MTPLASPDLVETAEFAGWIERLGPWPAPGAAAPVAIAVSGGADSLCLALLAAAWAGARRLPVLALVVDHGLRPESAREAAQTLDTLHRNAIPARLLHLDGLERGPGLAERARDARYGILLRACRETGAVDLLLGHHRADQAETVLMRRRAGSAAGGLAGMSPLLETDEVRLLRPLLRVDPARLRDTLRARGVGWVEDPSNRDRRAERTRIREELAIADTLRSELLRHADAAGQERGRARAEDAARFAATASLRPEGFAVLPPGLLPPDALAALIRTVGGRPHRPASDAVERLSRVPRAATLAGTRLLPAGRWGEGWLLVREAATLSGPVRAASGVRWDGRFILHGTLPPAGSTPAAASGRDALLARRDDDTLFVDALGEEALFVAALGDDAAAFRRGHRLPSAVLHALPALRGDDGGLRAVPHLGWHADPRLAALSFRFRPLMPASESTPFTIL